MTLRSGETRKGILCAQLRGPTATSLQAAGRPRLEADRTAVGLRGDFPVTMLAERANLDFVVERRAIVRAIQRLGHVLERGSGFGFANLDVWPCGDTCCRRRPSSSGLYAVEALDAAHRRHRIPPELTGGWCAWNTPPGPGKTHDDQYACG